MKTIMIMTAVIALLSVGACAGIGKGKAPPPVAPEPLVTKG